MRPRIPWVVMMAIPGLFGIAGLLAGAGCGHQTSSPRPITVKVMVLPDYSLNVMAARVAPLIAHLQKSLGPRYRVEWISCPSPEAFMATVERERPDVSLQDAFQTAWLIRLQQAEPILGVLMPDGEGRTRGLVITAADGDVRTLADLAGKRVAIASRRSYLGYIAQASMMEATANVHAGSIHFVPVRWSDRVGTCMEQGRVEAGFVSEADLVPRARVLARTEPVPASCVATFPHTSGEVADGVRRALQELGTGGVENISVLRGLGIRGFTPIDAQERATIVRLAENASVPY